MKRLQIEHSPEARELKVLLCSTCYQALIGWITGASLTPFTPCDPCAPVAETWLAARRVPS